MFFTHPQLKFNIKNLLLFFKPISLKKLKIKLANFFPNKNIVFTDSGRSAFQLAIENLNLQDSEILIPAYICDIFGPILKHYNIKPIYLDIDLKTFNLDLKSFNKDKITPKTKSILVCHTYGLPNDMTKITEFAQKYNLKIIEDCAHAFGAQFNDKYLGNFGDCAFFSLPKFLPVINGGMLILRGRTPKLLRGATPKFKDLVKFLRLFQFIAAFSEKFRNSNKTFTITEFSFPKKPCKSSLNIFNYYLKNYNKAQRKRIELAKFFQQELKNLNFEVQVNENNIFTYLSALVPENIDRNELFNQLRKRRIFCSRIWHKPMFDNLPNTSEAAHRIINFPIQNWFSAKDIVNIANQIRYFIK